MTQLPDLFAALAAPFDPAEVKVRTQAGRQLHYITARVVMNRLDDVLGPENWWDAYEPHENSVICTLSVRLPDGMILAKQDAGGFAGMADSGDDDKSGYSDALKRAAVKFGIGRYLYRDGVPRFAQDAATASSQATTAAPPTNGHGPANGRQAVNEQFRGQQPAQAPAQATNGHSPQGGNGNGQDRPPRTGKALFAWTKDQEQRYEVGLLKHLNSWAKLQEFPGRMVDWDADQVSLAYAEATRRLRSVQDHRGGAYEEALAN